jgi:hypothetical protein
MGLPDRDTATNAKLRCQQSRRASVSLAVENEVYDDMTLRRLIDSWIVPKMVDDWLSLTDQHANSCTGEDNGEQL